ncbi:peptidoglycan-binding protein [Baekduia soli]|uniref:Peptidoglycan-binding protein n=1 Tax=Baekduia soli TaxID=496014 RepID=A0A5B8U9X7_9ACTN|nr:peptidoglycan-binding domain-containing protein [Baekduia soli]QEC49421.1 peptidoglycan-binding protein [Baekduia soli]
MRARQPDRARTPPSPGPAAPAAGHRVLALQRVAGNRATAGVIRLARQVAGDPEPVQETESRPVAQALRARGAAFGESGPRVLRLQVLLNARLGDRVLNSDGVYGPRTEEQVAAFQASTRRFAPAPGPNPLPPPLPPFPGPGPAPDPDPPELEATGVADPATVAALEQAVRAGDGLEVTDLEVIKEAYRLVRDQRHALRLGLLSAVANAARMMEADGLSDRFRGTEIDYWEAGAEHANGHFATARGLYESILADEDEGGWDGLHDNCRLQLGMLESGLRATREFNDDPNLKEAGEE